jgi:hypothetical protein
MYRTIFILDPQRAGVRWNSRSNNADPSKLGPKPKPIFPKPSFTAQRHFSRADSNHDVAETTRTINGASSSSSKKRPPRMRSIPRGRVIELLIEYLNVGGGGEKTGQTEELKAIV